ncbi:hypothetical protein [Desulfobacter curvatus]|uniref:hypothetical protein n=1 Tax=Desulfobacter curvatus TaxID=2290 RepID=UPI0012FB7DB6|nr:hypothetical protein [Desulfobacter curvatus]
MKKLHTKFIEDGYNGVFMFDAMERKAKYATKEFNRQWLFQAKEMTFVPDTGERSLCHLHDRHIQKTIKFLLRPALPESVPEQLMPPILP